MKLKMVAFTVMATAVAALTRAQVSTVGLTDIGYPTTVSPGPDIYGASTYSTANLLAFGALGDNTGVFVGLPLQAFGALTINPSLANSLDFGNSVFGYFVSTSITVESAAEGSVSIQILGNYRSGSFDGEAIVNNPASLDLTFTQSPVGTGAIADSGVFSTTPTATPEPGSLALLGVGATALCVHLRRRKA
jgi:hypothetical protein